MKDEIKVDEAQAAARNGPKAGEFYRHFKGGEYVVIGCSVKEDTLEPLVTYKSLSYGFVWTRTLANFNERVGDEMPRFTRIWGKTTT